MVSSGHPTITFPCYIYTLWKKTNCVYPHNSSPFCMVAYMSAGYTHKFGTGQLPLPSCEAVQVKLADPCYVFVILSHKHM